MRMVQIQVLRFTITINFYNYARSTKSNGSGNGYPTNKSISQENFNGWP